MNDDQIQEFIEGGGSDPSKDAKAYNAVFRALRREPPFVLPNSFADKVVGRLAESRSSRDFIWFYVGLSSMVVTLAIVIALLGLKANFSFLSVGAFTFLSSYKGLVIFGVAFIGALQWIDKRFVKNAA